MSTNINAATTTKTDAVANTDQVTDGPRVEVTVGPRVASTRGSFKDVAATVVAVNTRFESDGSWVISPDKEFVLILQSDGNLCHYRVIGEPPSAPESKFMGELILSITNTSGKPGDYCLLQTDGNLCVYPKGGGTALWCSSKQSGDINNEYALYVQTDKNLVIYQTSAIWDSN